MIWLCKVRAVPDECCVALSYNHILGPIVVPRSLLQYGCNQRWVYASKIMSRRREGTGRQGGWVLVEWMRWAELSWVSEWKCIIYCKKCKLIHQSLYRQWEPVSVTSCVPFIGILKSIFCIFNTYDMQI